MRDIESNKTQVSVLMDYELYLTKISNRPPTPMKKETTKKKPENNQLNIDQQLMILEKELNQTDTQNSKNLLALKNKIKNFKPTPSEYILEKNIEKEKEYLQRTIIQMELKQFAESLSMITFKKLIQGHRRSDVNMPLLWKERAFHVKETPLKQVKKLNQVRNISLR